MDMVRPPGIMMIAPGIRAGLHRDEPVIAFVVRDRPSSSSEIRVEWRRMLIDIVYITAAGICLPDFHERVGNWTFVLVEHMAVHDDALTQRLTFVLLGQIGVAFLHSIVAIDRAGQLRQCMRRDDQWLRGGPLDRAAIVGREMLGENREALLRKNERHSYCPLLMPLSRPVRGPATHLDRHPRTSWQAPVSRRFPPIHVRPSARGGRLTCQADDRARSHHRAG